MSIQVEREIFYLEEVQKYSIRMTTVEKYGKHHPDYIYVSAIFDKNLDKAKQKAWDTFWEEIETQDRKDRMYDGKVTERIDITYNLVSSVKGS